jgi:hypothetical protein
MCTVWLTSSFNYYLVSSLLKYFPGSIYVNSSIAALSEILSILAAGIAY